MNAADYRFERSVREWISRLDRSERLAYRWRGKLVRHLSRRTFRERGKP
jgi:hypothetical protein